jgi:hypothetical protein
MDSVRNRPVRPGPDICRPGRRALDKARLPALSAGLSNCQPSRAAVDLVCYSSSVNLAVTIMDLLHSSQEIAYTCNPLLSSPPLRVKVNELIHCRSFKLYTYLPHGKYKNLSFHPPNSPHLHSYVSLLFSPPQHNHLYHETCVRTPPPSPALPLFIPLIHQASSAATPPMTPATKSLAKTHSSCTGSKIMLRKTTGSRSSMTEKRRRRAWPKVPMETQSY